MRFFLGPRRSPAQRVRWGRGGEAEHSRRNDGSRWLSAFLSRAELAPTWLGWQDSNLRMPESKSGALPLGDIPLSDKDRRVLRRTVRAAAGETPMAHAVRRYGSRQAKTCLSLICAFPGLWHRGRRLLYGVSDGTRTHGLQSHNLTR